MIWLASYPRSGSTFFRIVLDEVYGIESSTFHREKDYPLDPDYADYPVVKTHLLPHELVPQDPSIPAVYLVRDGRDCVVSLAHYRKQLLAQETNFEENLAEAIEAEGGSHFGGWSEHVRRWSARAVLVLRFEHLIADPIGCAEQLRPWLKLPEPRTGRLPGFAQLKSRDFKYGSGREHGFDSKTREHWRTAKFRRGRTGAWKDELPERLHRTFLRLHGEELARLGYVEPPAGKPSQVAQAKRESASVCRKDGRNGSRGPGATARRRGPSRKTGPKKCVLIDGSKLLDPRMDGIKRYVQELLRAMLPIARDRKDGWEFHVRFGACGTFRLLDVTEDVEKGRPPLSKIHKLFRPDDENPINVYRRHLRESGARPAWDRLRDLAHYNYLKTIRSLHKRRHELAQLRERLSGSWAPLWFSESLSGYDLVHLTLPNTWSLYRRLEAPLLVTVHDLCHEVCPQFQNASNNRSLSAGLRFAAQADCDYIAVSQSTKDQMTKSLNVDPARVRVVHEACDDRRFRPVGRTAELRRVRSAYGIPEEPYVLSLCTLEPRKNLLGAVRAFNQLTDESPGLGANLVIAGSFGWGNSRELDEALRGRPRIRVIGHVEEADLPALYSGAAAFCYVSHYEGFGLPLVEAMSCGVPSVYGDVSSMPEIVKGAGLAADPDDVPQISQRLRQLLEDDELRRRLAHRAVFRSLDFSWPKTAEETFACYARVLEARGAEAPAAERRDGGDLSAPASRIETHGVGGRHAAA